MRRLGGLFAMATALGMVALYTGCASGQAAVRIGREPQGIGIQLRDLALVELKGESGAIAALIAEGVSEREARKRVDDALIAAHAASRKEQ